MFLPSYSSLGVPPTEEDAHRCASFANKGNNRMSFRAGSAPFDECIQLYYENFRIEIVSPPLTIIVIFSFLFFVYGFVVSLVSYEYDDVIVMKVVFFSRVVVSLVDFFTLYKIFYGRVYPETSSREDFKIYVKSIVRLSNFIVIATAVINGVTFAWKSSLGSCLHFSEDGTATKNEDMYTFHCNPSYESGSPSYDTMLLLFAGNIFVIGLLRSHSYWAACVNYVVTLACTIAGAVVSDVPINSPTALFCSIFAIFLINGIESNNMTMFSALLELESTNRVKTTELKQFVGNVAHDLKTPLHGFLMCVDHLLLDTAQHMADSKEKVEIVDQLQMCKTNCSFMTVAINRTVDFAKSASDIALMAKMEPASITDSMQWAVTCLNSSQPNVSIEMLPLPAGICDYIVTDRHWLMENVLCYLSNAVKYSAGGHVTVSASLVDGDGSSSSAALMTSTSRGDSEVRSKGKYSLHPSSPAAGGGSHKRNIFTRAKQVHPGTEGILSEFSMSSAEEYESRRPLMQQLRITVEDEGIGINDEKKSTLFKPFQQTMRLAGGTGLGLFSLSKRIEVLKGRFGVEDRPDGQQGSCFWFSIPYTPDEDSANVGSLVSLVDSMDEISSSVYMTPGSSAVLKDTPTALVVDDSVVIVKATKRMLMKAGYIVEVADNGAIGLEMMKSKVYSIVIMDLQMPVMDGLESTRRIRVYEGETEFQASGNHRQFIIGASANGTDDVMRDALESGMDVFVEKPFSVSILAECQRQAKREPPDNLV